ncbi:hypothetical protein BC936DRAFT_141724 [Jimgerdemannia flammicorona]|uniref:SUZ domain-containing protein n=1 Tax=Jimgerdemannia flammicorona TaxID=994334 RepID=A0A433A1R5_9FUNG|nr:hypothetical protein BC936DRAFT_141724 [Jimgerdemannia flammicorona]
MNAYQRLVVHRVAQYFKLNHFVDHPKKAVYLCKCPTTEIPAVRFTDLIEAEEEDAQETPKIKIMRRSPTQSPGRFGNNGDGGDKGEIDRSKMTLEERQVAYEEARKRIFQDLEKKGTEQEETNHGSNSSSPTMRSAESGDKEVSPTASNNGEADVIKGSKTGQPQRNNSGHKKGNQQGKQNSNGSNSGGGNIGNSGNNGNSNIGKPPLNRNGSGGSNNNNPKSRQYTPPPASPFDRGFLPQPFGNNYSPRPGPLAGPMPGMNMGGAPPTTHASGYFNPAMVGFDPTTAAAFTFPREGMPSNQTYAGMPGSQSDWSYGPPHPSRDVWGQNPPDMANKNNTGPSVYYSRPPASQPVYAPPRPPSFRGDETNGFASSQQQKANVYPPQFMGPYGGPMYGNGVEAFKNTMDGSVMSGGQPMMQKPGNGSVSAFGGNNAFDPSQAWWANMPQGNQWTGFNPNVGTGGEYEVGKQAQMEQQRFLFSNGPTGPIYNGAVAQQGMGREHKFTFGGSVWTSSPGEVSPGGMFSPTSVRHLQSSATMPQHMMMPPVTSAGVNNNTPSRRVQSGPQGPGFMAPNANQLAQDFMNLNMMPQQQQQQQKQHAYAAAAAGNVNPGIGAPVVTSPTALYDVERRPPKSTELFDPNGPTPSNSATLIATASAAASGNAFNGANVSSRTGASSPISPTGAYTPTRRKDNMVDVGNGANGTSSSSSGMVRSHSLHLPQPPASPAYQNLHRAASSSQATGRKKDGGAMPGAAATGAAATGAAATGAAAVTAAGTGTIGTAGTGLLYDYSLQTSYDGVKPADVAAPAAVQHILELYDFAEGDVLADVQFPNCRTKHIPPGVGAPPRARGVFLAIFKKASQAHEIMAMHQARESQGPTRFKVRVWEPVKPTTSSQAESSPPNSAGTEEEKSFQEGTDIEKAAEA